jgi:AcrR family transcriptional regulator
VKIQTRRRSSASTDTPRRSLTATRDPKPSQSAIPLNVYRRSRRVLREEEILDAAMTRLGDGGPNAVSVRAIAAKVGVAPNAVYTYFPDKAAVIKRIRGAAVR